jgi:excisionase family DNA binding protein
MDALAAKISERLEEVLLKAIQAKETADDCLTIKEVAKKLKKHPTTVMNIMRDDKAFPVGMKVGRVYRFRKKDIDKYLEQKSKQSEKIFRTHKQSKYNNIWLVR